MLFNYVVLLASSIFASLPKDAHQNGLYKRNDAASFSYKNASTWGQEFPGCALKTGEIQSPIAFGPGLTYPSQPANVLSWKSSMNTTAVFQNHGHGLDVVFDAASGFTLNNQGLTYDLAAMHCHSNAEHTLDGKSFDLECHFIHKAVDSKLAVYGMWFSISQQESAFFKSLFGSGMPKTPEDVIDVKNLDFSSLNTQIAGKDAFA